jgi:integrase
MREGEILGLDIKYIDFKNLRIEVAQQYTGKELKKVLKTSSSYGYVEIEQAVADELQRYIKENAITSGLLFTNESGNPIDKNNMVRRWYKPLLESLKFDTSMRFHDLRHTYASIMLSYGVSYLYVSRQMRHSKPSVTLDIYAHFIPDSNKQAVKIIGQKFSEQIVSIEDYRAQKKRAETL